MLQRAARVARLRFPPALSSPGRPSLFSRCRWARDHRKHAGRSCERVPGTGSPGPRGRGAWSLPRSGVRCPGLEASPRWGLRCRQGWGSLPHSPRKEGNQAGPRLLSGSRSFMRAPPQPHTDLTAGRAPGRWASRPICGFCPTRGLRPPPPGERAPVGLWVRPVSSLEAQRQQALGRRAAMAVAFT